MLNSYPREKAGNHLVSDSICLLLKYAGKSDTLSCMIVQRWEAPLTPTKTQIIRQYLSEGLEAFEEVYQPTQQVVEHRHPFCEVRTLIEGEMLFNIAGNQFLLRAGDRVEIPGNTKHTHTAQGNQPCICIVGYRVI